MTETMVEVLLVEDNSRDVELTLRALKKHNLANRVHVVKDGAEAMEVLFSEGNGTNRSLNRTLKVVLLDLKLPKVDGMEVLRKIKSNERTRHIPVVILTSSQEERDLIESYKLGANSYIVKPMEFDKFVQAVSELGLYWLLINKTPG